MNIFYIDTYNDERIAEGIEFKEKVCCVWWFDENSPLKVYNNLKAVSEEATERNCNIIYIPLKGIKFVWDPEDKLEKT